MTAEQRFRRAGLPTFVEGRRAAEDVWARATPVLWLVLLAELVDAADPGLPWWADVLAVLGVTVVLTGLGAAFNRVKGRPGVLPVDVDAPELVAFVVVATAAQLAGGQPVGAAAVFAGNLALLAGLYVTLTYGLVSIVGFTARRLARQLRQAVDLIARALPLLLLFSLVLFINTEMWQVFSTMEVGRLVGAGALLAGVGSAFLAIRLPREVAAMEAEVDAGPPLTRAERLNVGLVLYVSQALQVLVVTAGIAVFFVALGVLVIDDGVLEAWLGAGGHHIEVVGLQLSTELLRISAAIGALSGLYYTVAVLTDATYREEFLTDLTEGMRETFVERAKYLEDRRP